ncbi:exported hypothetical protein [Agrobacterium deltaense Zutra 3/1]|uniref:Lipoprotein n=1 Tax=Agrobacterium deltaense Zutra 3/1 TaxID=1183427 RepID=A0A1S7RLW0_9HYPH|nr:hypothetical protein [Agrobacterium deltaense]CUX54472.1 exported hypothetical protein [Agrobacterium deltaense Zutra 3/1]
MTLHAKARALLVAVTMTGACTASAQQASIPDQPLIGNLKMPSMTPEQAEEVLKSRKLPPIDPVPVAAQSRTGNQPLMKFEIKAILGHELPGGDTTPHGMKRADFAIASPDAPALESKLRKDALGPDIIMRPLPAETAVEEKPPVIGLP